MLPEYGDPWRTVRKIGEGCYGDVYLLEKEELGKTYQAALKIISIPKSDYEITVKLFDREETKESVAAYFRLIADKLATEHQIMRKLRNHPHIVDYESHKIKEHKDGIGYDFMICMEYLEPFEKYYGKYKNTFTHRDVVQLGIDICLALEECQKFDIIHRDIKPANIFVTKDRKFKLGDFGIARIVDEHAGNDMSARTGTINYMAPEIYNGMKDYQFDVDMYSLGIVLYRLLNYNRLPFCPVYTEKLTKEAEEAAVQRRMKGEKIPPPAQENSRLSEIILKACSFDPGFRYSSPYAMRKDLESILRTEEEEQLISEERTGLKNFQKDGKTNKDSVNSKTVSDNGTENLSDTVKDTEQLGKLENISKIETLDNTLPIFPNRKQSKNGKSVSVDEGNGIKPGDKNHGADGEKPEEGNAGNAIIDNKGETAGKDKSELEEESDKGETKPKFPWKRVWTGAGVATVVGLLIAFVVINPFDMYLLKFNEQTSMNPSIGTTDTREVAEGESTGEMHTESDHESTVESELENETPAETAEERKPYQTTEIGDANVSITKYYDAAHNMVKEEQIHADGSPGFITECIYPDFITNDENENWQTETLYHANGKVWKYSEREYEKNQIKKQSDYVDNELVCYMLYSWDSDGNQSGYDIYSQENQLLEQHTFSYRSDGSYTEKIVSDESNVLDVSKNKDGKVVDIFIVELEYDISGQQVKQLNYDKKGNLITYCRLKYDYMFRLTQQNWYYADDTVEGHVEYTYDDNGSTEKITTYNAYGSILTYRMIEKAANGNFTITDYNSDGSILLQQEFNEEGEPLSTDTYGNATE